MTTEHPSDYKAVTLKDVKKHPIIDAYIRASDESLSNLGFTEHGFRHANLVAHIAENVMLRLDRPKREAELAAIAGYVHDVGNVVGRPRHGQSGGIIVSGILNAMGMDPEEVAIIVSAVGNHEEEYGSPVNAVAAALILADKSDVHKTRVRNKEIATFDIHDRVNYAAERSFLDVDPETRNITLAVTIDTSITSVMEYFEIFLTRMIMCRRAAEVLGCRFGLEINGARLL